MDRGTAIMQGVRAKISRHMAWIAKSCYSVSASFDPTPATGGEFSIIVVWRNKDGTDGTYRHEFTRPYVMGRTYHLSSAAWSADKCAIEFGRDIIREVLDRRMNRGT